MDRLLHYYFNLDYMARSLPALLGGMLVTIEIALWTIVGGLALGLALAMLRAFGSRVLNCRQHARQQFFEAIVVAFNPRRIRAIANALQPIGQAAGVQIAAHKARNGDDG